MNVKIKGKTFSLAVNGEDYQQYCGGHVWYQFTEFDEEKAP